MLADTEVEVSAAYCPLSKSAAPRSISVLVDGAEVGRAAEQPGHVLATAFCTVDSFACGHALASAGNVGMSASQPSGSSPFCMRYPFVASPESLLRSACERAFHSAPTVTALEPCPCTRAPPSARGTAHQRPAVGLLWSRRISSSPKRFAVRRGSVLLVRGAPRDMAVHDDERRALRYSFCAFRIATSSSSRSLASPTRTTFQCSARNAWPHRRRMPGGAAFDGDAVVVVDPDQIGETKMSCDGRRFCDTPSIRSPSPQKVYTR